MSWQPKATQNAKALRLFNETMKDMEESLISTASIEELGQIRSLARSLSIGLRKLLFDGNPLINAVINRPQLHPLFDRNLLTGDTYTNSSFVQVGLATSEKVPFGPAASHNWEITVHPLHGLKFDAAGKKWILEGVFDASATPLRLDSWQRQRLFCVDGREYSLGDALKFLANREAAHVDTRMDIHAGDMERVHFGSTTYCHIVAVLAGSYVLEQYRISRKVNKDLWDAFASVELAQLMSPQGSWGAEFTNANIDPMGLPGGAHETGIQIPEPGKPWQPVQISEAWVVSS